MSDIGSAESFAARNDVVRKSDLTKQARARDQSGWTERPPNANPAFENIPVPGGAMPTSEDKPAYCNVEQVFFAYRNNTICKLKELSKLGFVNWASQREC